MIVEACALCTTGLATLTFFVPWLLQRIVLCQRALLVQLLQVFQLCRYLVLYWPSNIAEAYLLEAVNELLSDTTFQLGTERLSLQERNRKNGYHSTWEMLFLESELLKHLKRCTRDGLSTRTEGSISLACFTTWDVSISSLHWSSLFYQYLTRLFLMKFIKLHFPLPAADNSSSIFLNLPLNTKVHSWVCLQ